MTAAVQTQVSLLTVQPTPPPPPPPPTQLSESLTISFGFISLTIHFILYAKFSQMHKYFALNINCSIC